MHSHSIAPLLCAAALLVDAAPQPAQDMSAILARIRAAAKDSRAAAIGIDLADRIGPRLTWSPDLVAAQDWAALALAEAGLRDIHREPIGRPGLGWRQETVWLRMTAPDSMMVVAQAAPWSKNSAGEQSGDAVLADIRREADFDRYRGKLAGKVVVLGTARPADEDGKPLFERLTDEASISAALTEIRTYFADRLAVQQRRAAREPYRRALGAFLAAEKPRLVLTMGRPMPHGGDSGLVAVDMPFVPAAPDAWHPETRLPIPILYAMPEHFNRIARLLAAGTPVRLNWRIDTAESGVHDADNLVADLPGTDPRRKGQMVLIGAHLDSWAAGTGAADNGAGVAMTIDALRLLQRAGYRPRRTIRVLFYAGEEQGLLGSQAYADRHLGRVPRLDTPEQRAIPVESLRLPAGPLVSGPDLAKVSAAINIDDGAGRIRGVFTGGGNPALAATLRNWSTDLGGVGPIRVFDESDWPADQWVYTQLGLPTLSFLQDPLDYDTRAHHTSMDTADRLSPEDMRDNAVVIASLLAQIGDAGDLLPRPAAPNIPTERTTHDDTRDGRMGIARDGGHGATRGHARHGPARERHTREVE